MNDPIPFYRDGAFHVFYQHNPGAPVWGNMHWGHAVSRDLLHWEEQPIALAPDQPYDFAGVFTGSIVESGGVFYAFYTGIERLEGLMQTQCLATSRDLVTWTKVDQNPLIAETPKGYGPCFRDPQVFRYEGEWRMIVGSDREGEGAVLQYASGDLLKWRFLGPVCHEGEARLGREAECPDLFPLGDSWVLLSSRDVVYWNVGHFDGASFVAEASGELDGASYYAAKSVDAQGRRLLFGWLTEPKGDGWSGALALPRELYLDSKGVLGQRPARECLSLGTQSPDGSWSLDDEGIVERANSGKMNSTWTPG